MRLTELSRVVGRQLRKKRMTISLGESCTGGMLGSIITQISGSSKYFLGGVVAYSNEIKKSIVGVKLETLNKFGAVSAEVAQEMAQGVRSKFRSDIGIGITGIAGPLGGTKNKPVGLVYICVVLKKKVTNEKFIFKGGREKIRKQACRNALMITNCLLRMHDIS
jgi:PncC family amidohydrolase